MTTIFASAAEGVMVTDSKCTSDSTWFPMTKVYRVRNELVGIAGNVKDDMAWLEWYQGGKKGARPKMESFSALILKPTGLFEVSTDGLEQVIDRGYHGIGSGGGYAIAAFMAGKTAEESVHIALDIDANSGGAVIVHTLVKP